jgi:hypothetical protein
LRADLKERDAKIAGLDAQNRKLLLAGRKQAAPVEHSAPAIQPHNMEIKTDALPDPIANPKEYAAELTKQLRGQVGAVLASEQAARAEEAKANQAQAARAATLEAMWGKLVKEHPEFESIRDIVEAQAQKVVKDGVAMGGTLETIVFDDPDQFVKDVTERVVKRAGELGLALGEPEAASPKSVSTEPADEADADAQSPFPTTLGEPDAGAASAGNALAAKQKPTARTALQGGDFGAPAPTRPAADKPSDLVSDLRQIQSAMGLY